MVVNYNDSESAANSLVEKLLQEGHEVLPLQADIADPPQAEKLVRQAAEKLGRLDLLVNNASRFYPNVVGETHAWQWEDLMNSNLRGPWFLVQALLGQLRAAGGCVVNIIDVYAERPLRGHSAYCISKAGLAMMTRALARELGPEVRVNGVSPGAILWPETTPAELEQNEILGRTALGRLGEPGDIASAVAYLALDAPYVTGQILAVDGGRSLNI